MNKSLSNPQERSSNSQENLTTSERQSKQSNTLGQLLTTLKEKYNQGQIEELMNNINYLLDLFIISDTNKARTATFDNIRTNISLTEKHGIDSEDVKNVINLKINNFIKQRDKMDDNQWIQYCKKIKENLGLSKNENNDKRIPRVLITINKDNLDELINNDNIQGAQEIVKNIENYELTNYLVMTLTILGVFHNIGEDKLNKIIAEQKINRVIDREDLRSKSSNIDHCRGKSDYRDLQDEVEEYFKNIL